MRRQWQFQEEDFDPEKWWGLRLQCLLIREGRTRAIRLVNLRSTPLINIRVSVNGTIYDDDIRVFHFQDKPIRIPRLEAFASVDTETHDGFVEGASYSLDCKYADIDGSPFYENFHFYVNSGSFRKNCLRWSNLDVITQFGQRVGKTVWNLHEKLSSARAGDAIDMSSILVLGPDSGKHIEKLKKIQDAISLLGYNSALVRDQKEFGHETVEQKLMRVAMSTRFTLVEDSIAAGQIDELSLLARSRGIVAILREHAKGGTWMQSDYDLDFPIEYFTYRSNILNDLSRTVTRAVDWAESKLRNRAELLGKRYPWRRTAKP